MSSLASYEGRLCCAICGDAILQPTQKLDVTTKWQSEAVLLSDPAREFERLEEHYRGGKRRNAPRLDLPITQDIRKGRARLVEGDRFQLITAEREDAEREQEEVRANYSYGREEDGQWTPTPYYIATHEACLEVAETTMSRSPHDIPVRDLRTLWKVLRMRFEVDDSYYMSTVTGAVSRPQRIRLPHGYYMPFRPSNPEGVSLSEQIDMAGRTENKIDRWEAAYPLHIPDVTSTVLGNLKSLPSAPPTIPEAVAFHKRFLTLPAELRDHICSFLASRNGIPSMCNGLLPQWVWREVLLGGECLPFLRDLDIAVVEKFCVQWDREHQGQEPNWELLVRKLSQDAWSVWDAETSSLKVPNGLRNRRRIGKLVEEMYVGDLVSVGRTSHVGSDPIAVPRYWDESGHMVYPVVRVNAGSREKYT